MKKFEGVLKKHPNLDSAYVEIPFDVEKEYGKKRVKIRATIDGQEYRGSLVRMGMPCYWLGVTQDMRRKIGKEPGAEVSVTIEEDKEERKIAIPAELQEHFTKDTAAFDFFKSLSFTNQKEYILWITTAKRPETRLERITRTIDKLSLRKKNPSEK